MAADGMNHFFAHAAFVQQFGSLDAMLLRVLLKVDVVRAFHSGQSHHAEAQFHAVIYKFILHIDDRA
jgi:hypothetical protein